MAKDSFDFNLNTIIPTANAGFTNVGFLFGAGASVEAGFPVTMKLTLDIIEQLSEESKSVLQDVLDKHSKIKEHNYNLVDNIPDIERLLDMLKQILIYSTEGAEHDRFSDLEKEIKTKIHSILSSVTNPNIAYHNRFLNAIKRRIGQQDTPVYVITTNYDKLFEQAAFYTNFQCENGFVGPYLRYFDSNVFSMKKGKCVNTTFNRRFNIIKEPVLNLIKIHGSLSWYKKDGTLFETFDREYLKNDYEELMIYPQLTKTVDTMEQPYSSLFLTAHDLMGKQIKYLVSCGYSYRDKHINDRIIIPALKANSINIFALFKDEPEGIDDLKKYSNFSYLTEEVICHRGTTYKNEHKNLWKFSEFVNLINGDG